MLKYEMIAQEINEYIEKEHYEAGDKLPNVEKFKEIYGVSKSTVIKALENLEKKGIIFQTRGSGIYVRNKKKDGYVNLFSASGFHDEIVGRQLTYEVKKVAEVTPSKHVQKQLKLEADEPIYKVERVIYVDNKTFCTELSYFNKSVVLYLNEGIAESSIFEYLEQHLKVKIGFSDIYFKVDKLTENEAPKLSLQAGEPCLRYEQLFYTTTGVPFDYSQLVYHYENALFYIPALK
ncbi:GntR family transcriptional regulator [Staphylococcus arlettae]|uniref:GntR family transcriptional regulator n=1 Tax=Staphylococcus arlettae TaxID=29378 RepID=UPI000D1BE0ED|nr:GntR family transcriptional regulator [Staphylococcus arlettae]PTH35214.1 GntR family transcriptional regulator [Staphylococcus arlettae]RIM59348.1 GntR family transcriptional regulator [Staphylococcus arlettae]